MFVNFSSFLFSHTFFSDVYNIKLENQFRSNLFDSKSSITLINKTLYFSFHFPVYIELGCCTIQTNLITIFTVNECRLKKSLTEIEVYGSGEYTHKRFSFHSILLYTYLRVLKLI